MISSKFRWVLILGLAALVIGNMYIYLQYRQDLPPPTLTVGTAVDTASDIIAIEYNAETHIISIIVKNGWNFTGSADLLNRIPTVNEFVRIRGICQPEGYILIQEGYVMSSTNTWIIRIASVGGYLLVLALWIHQGIEWVKETRKNPKESEKIRSLGQ